MKLVYGSLTALLLCVCTALSAQKKGDTKFGKIVPADFILPVSPIIDSNASAVIIADIGITDFKGNTKGWFSYIFKRKTRIKILNKKAFDLATVKIMLDSYEQDEEKLSDVLASTYNLDNGNVTETKMEKKDLFSDKKDKNRVEQKFTMPAVKEGSIIEYSYTVTSDFIFNMTPWEFQNINYPCLWSEYQVTVPNLLGYVVQRNGVHDFFIDKQEDGHANYTVIQHEENGYSVGAQNSLNVSANTLKRRWVMKDVPAFYVENYLSSPGNYLDRIEFQLRQTYNGETMTDVKNNWKKVTEDLLKDKDFGSFMNGEENNSWLDKAVSAIIKNNTKSALQQAKDIYYYVATNFTCTNHFNKYITTSLQDVYKKHSGNVGELNLLLTALLQRNLVNAAPVLLSTREYGFNYASYPVMDRLNYVICRAVIDGTEYFLDASHSDLGFGYLPENCYNGHARIISRTDSASIYLMADSLKERKMTSVFITNDNKLGLTGSFKTDLGYYESYDLREKLNGTDKYYFKNLKSAFSFDIDISNGGIDSLKQVEFPVSVHYEFAFKPSGDESIIYFNPMMTEAYKENPFKAAERKYPVEMPYTTDETYILNMEIPKDYILDELPKSTKVSFNVTEGFFEYIVQKSGDMVMLRSRLKLNKANFTPADYNSLRDFFGMVVKKQAEQIVFKKKK